MKKKAIKKSIRNMIAFLLLTAQLFSQNMIITHAAETDTYTEKIDLTGLSTGELSHSHVLESKYDSTAHWEQCTICNQKFNYRKHNIKTYYTRGEATCHLTNKLVTYCADECGYKVTTPTNIEHTLNGEIIPTALFYEHYNYCTVCKTWMNVEHCVDENGDELYCENAEGKTCAICGYTFNKIIHFSSGGKCSRCGKTTTTNIKNTTTYENYSTYSYINTKVTGTLANVDAENVTSFSSIVDVVSGLLPCTYTLTNSNYNSQTGDFEVEYQVKVPNQDYDGEVSISIYIEYNFNNEKYQSRVYEQQLSTENKAPKVTNTKILTEDGGIINAAAWTKEAYIDISGTEEGSNYVYVSVYAEDDTPIFTDVTIPVNADDTWTLNKKLSNVEAPESGSQIKIEVKDSHGNTTTANKTIYKIDNKAPELITNLSEIDLLQSWGKNKTINLYFKDNGCQNIKTSINSRDNMTPCKKTSNGYQKTYIFTGDLYEENNIAIYYEDECGNYSYSVLPINKLDNTSPTITATRLDTEDYVSKAILHIDANDEFNNVEGSGNIQYRLTPYNDVDTTDTEMGLWQNRNYFTINSNGHYIVEVKDEVGNITPTTVMVKNIDNEAPIILRSDISYDSGNNMNVMLEVEDKISGLKEYSIDNGATWQAIMSKERYTIRESFKREDSLAGVTIQIKDNANNLKEYNTSADSNIPVVKLDRLTEIADGYIESVKIKAEVTYGGTLDDKPYGFIKWNGSHAPTDAENWSASNAYTVTSSGKYRCFVKADTGAVGYADISVYDVDRDAPTIKINTEKWNWDTKEATLKIEVADYDSKIRSILFKGNTLSTNEEIKEFEGKELAEFTRDVKLNANITFQVWAYDLAGNESTVKIFCDENGSMIKDNVTVTFIDYDGTIICTKNIIAGNNVVAPENPTRQGFVFAGWDKSLVAITEDTTIQATYTEIEPQKCTIVFKDYDGTVLKTETVMEGGSATPPENPSRDGYTFKGWNGDYVNVSKGSTCTAIYDKNKEQYKVTFIDYTGVILDEVMVYSKESAKAPTPPTRENYTFVGWDKSYMNVTEDITCKAVYTKNNTASSNNEVCKVIFKDYNGVILKTEQVKYRGSATPPTNPTREGYTFAGWDGSYSYIESDMTITAIYTEIKKDSDSVSDDKATVVNTDNKNNKNGTYSTGTASTGTNNSTNATVSKSTKENTKEEKVIAENENKDDKGKIVSLENMQVRYTDLGIEYKEGKQNKVHNSETTIEDTMDVGEEEKAPTQKTIGFYLSIIFLVGAFAFVIFYYLNKKKGWVDMPSIAFLDNIKI